MSRAEKQSRPVQAEPSTDMHVEIPRQHIAEAAYYKAEKRGFVPGFEELDWEEAETEVLSKIVGGTDLDREA
jgi:hypothetical protein